LNFPTRKLSKAFVPVGEKPGGETQVKLVMSNQLEKLTDGVLTVCRAVIDSHLHTIRWQVWVVDLKAKPKELETSEQPLRGSVGCIQKVQVGCGNRVVQIRKMGNQCQVTDIQAEFLRGRANQPCSLEGRAPLASWVNWANESRSPMIYVAYTEASGLIQGELETDEIHQVRLEEA
jgi:hypothetical protein